MNNIYNAKKRIDLLKNELGEIKKVFISDEKGVFGQSLFIKFQNGMNLQLHNKEINYQANEFIESEKQDIITNK